MSSTGVVEDKENRRKKSIFISFLDLKVSHTDNRGSQVSTQQYKSCQLLHCLGAEEQKMGWTIQGESIRYGNC